MESQDEEISFILSAKEQFSQVDLTDETNIIVHCKNILQHCEHCISKIFEMITPIANGTEHNVNGIVDHIKEITLILEMLKKFINTLIEMHSFMFEKVKSFPFITGKIIFMIFSHCKESGTLYGVNMDKVEEMLKRLFSSCQELQSIYLKILTTQFIYSLPFTEEIDMLVNVLNINLQIAEVANDLDVKTMAEQWKSYILLFEKYSPFLKNTLVFNTTLNSVVKLVVNSIKSVIEDDHSEKHTLRTLKVANFLLKILGKLYEIFKDSSGNDYGQVVYMFSYLKVFSSEYLATLGKPADLSQKMNDHLSQIIDHLLKLLTDDNRFLHDFITFNLGNLEGDIMLGYVHLLICIMINITVAFTDNTERPILNNYGHENIITFLFNLLPKCHTFFTLNVQYYCSTQSNTSLSLYEHLLMNTAILVTTCDSYKYTIVEKCMYEALLDVDFWKALFACDLWIILASYAPMKLIYDQLIFLCDAYKKLNGNKLFRMAPQKVHFNYILEGLYKALSIGFKTEFSEKYPIEDNLVLWQAIKIKNIPCEIASKTVLGDFNILLEQVEKKLLRHADHRIYKLINIYKIMSTSPQLSVLNVQKLNISKKWDLQILLEDKLFIDKEEEEITWFVDYIEALCAITEKIIKENGVNTADLKKIFLSISVIMCKTKSVAVKFMLLMFLYQSIKTEKFKLSIFNTEIVNILYEALKCDNRLLQAIVCEILSYLDVSNKIIATKLLGMVEHMQNQKEYLLFMIKNRKLKIDSKLSRREQLLLISRIEYSHKCLYSQLHIENRCENFGIDLDSLLEVEEPANKKTKLDFSYVDTIISKLEDNTRVLSEYNRYDFNDEHRTRIAALYEKLKCLCS